MHPLIYYQHKVFPSSIFQYQLNNYLHAVFQLIKRALIECSAAKRWIITVFGQNCIRSELPGGMDALPLPAIHKVAN